MFQRFSIILHQLKVAIWETDTIEVHILQQALSYKPGEYQPMQSKFF